MKKYIKYLTVVMALVFACMAFVPSGFATSSTEENSSHLQLINKDEKVIMTYYSLLSERGLKTKMWAKGDAPISSVYVEALNEAASLEMDIEDVAGINNVLSMSNPTILSQIPNSGYEEYCEEIEDPALYLVRVEEHVIEDDGFNFEGVNYHVIICGTEGGVRVVCDSRLPMPNLVEEYESNITLGNAYLAQRFGGTNDADASIQSDDPISFSHTKPSTIKVKRTKYGNGVISTVNFKTYCKNVALYEIGYNSWDSDALKAGALALRNFAWYKVLTASTTAGYHLQDHGDYGAQVYNPSGGRSESSYPNVISAVNSTWDLLMMNSASKLFLSQYSTGTSGSYGTKNCGYLRHYGAKKHADDGRSFVYILNWYYGSSIRSSGNIIITCSGSHTFGSTWNKTSTQHYKACTKCEQHGSAAGHSWVLSSDKTKVTCSVCGYTTNQGAGVMKVLPKDGLLTVDQISSSDKGGKYE